MKKSCRSSPLEIDNGKHDLDCKDTVLQRSRDLSAHTGHKSLSDCQPQPGCLFARDWSVV